MNLWEVTVKGRHLQFGQFEGYVPTSRPPQIKTPFISDFIDDDKDNNPRFDEAIRIANRKHDIIGLKIYDKREKELPSIGIVRMKDAETGEYAWVDTTSLSLRRNYANWYKTMDMSVSETLVRAGVDFVSIATDQDYVKPLINLFKKR